MNILAAVLVGLVAALHAYFLVLEMFLWTTPTGRQVFGTDRRVRRADQGARGQPGPLQRVPRRRPGLGSGREQTDVKLFFLACVVVAGVYGAATVNRRILLVQAVPALLALGAVLAAR